MYYQSDREMTFMTMLFKEPVRISNQQARWMETRGWVYQLLAEFFSRPPRVSLIAHWRRQVELKQIIPVSEGGKKIKSYLETIPETDFRRVCLGEAEEYRRLFSGQSRVLTSCESLFRAKDEDVDAFSCLSDIRQTYMERGVVFNKISGECDDHIALELEFMAVLGEETLCKAGLPDSCLGLAEAQIRFLESHLMKWAPRFASELVDATSSPLYAGLAELLVEFLAMDLEHLRELRNLIS